MSSTTNLQYINLYKKPLQWKPKSVAQKGNDVNDGDDATADFSDLLYNFRGTLKMLKDDEGSILSSIDRKLTDVENLLGSSDFLPIFDRSIARLNKETETSEQEAKQLANSLKAIYVLADNISSRVSALDTARGRVVECLQRVSDLRDLRTCAEGVKAAMEQEEYDEAALHVHRFFALDTDVFKLGDQIDSNDSNQSMKSCYETLRQAAADLKVIIERKFDEARAANDFASMERFFKLFPLINEHFSGLKRFATYLCAKIEKLGDENFKIMQAGGTDDKRKNVIYADTLTMIFEGIARLIELHQPLIDNFYGPDKLLLLLELIQPECDKQTIRVTNAFLQKRQLDFKSKQVDAYLRGTVVTETKIDALELDVLLSEITLMHTRAELYWRFLKRRLVEAPARPLSESEVGRGGGWRGGALNRANSVAPAGTPQSPTGSINSVEVCEDSGVLPELEFFEAEEREESAEQRRKAMQSMREARDKKLDSILYRTALNMKMQEILGMYVLMEQYYMVESVKKAIHMDDVEEGSLTSTILDDVFFIVRKSIRRSISSSSVDCVCAMLNNGVTLLETEYLKYINTSIRAGYPSVGWTAETAYQTAQTAYNVIQHGKAAAESSSEKQKTSFLVALNNLRASIECVNTLRTGLHEDVVKHLPQISQQEKGKMENSMSQMDDLCKKIEYYVNLGISKVCDAAFRSKIKSSAEAYLDLSHTLTDEQLAEFEAVDPFVEQFIASLDKQVAHFESLMVPENYQALLMEVSIEALRQFERVILKCVFNRLGGLQLDKDYRQLTTYLTSIAGWSIRQKCFKLSQIVALLNSENFDEAVEFFQQQQQTSGVSVSSSDQLSLSETKKVLALRTDFSRERIKNLTL